MLRAGHTRGLNSNANHGESQSSQSPTQVGAGRLMDMGLSYLKMPCLSLIKANGQNHWKKSASGFETMEVFADELDRLVAQLMEKKIPLRNMVVRGPNSPPLLPPEWYLSAEGRRPSVSHWTGPHSQLLKESWQVTAHLGPDPMEVTEICYYVVEASWGRVQG